MVGGRFRSAGRQKLRERAERKREITQTVARQKETWKVKREKK
jgi:hypothetical protein